MRMFKDTTLEKSCQGTRKKSMPLKRLASCNTYHLCIHVVLKQLCQVISFLDGFPMSTKAVSRKLMYVVEIYT